jgi:hypothetical protein
MHETAGVPDAITTVISGVRKWVSRSPFAMASGTGVSTRPARKRTSSIKAVVRTSRPDLIRSTALRPGQEAIERTIREGLR